MLKRSRLNLDALVLARIGSFLHARQQFLIENGYHIVFTQVIIGSPQASILGPLLFLIFVNQLPTEVSLHMRVFAKDSSVYPSICNTSHQLFNGRA